MKKEYLLTLAISLIASHAYAQKFTIAEVTNELISGANTLNRTLPMFINKDIRLDTSIPGPGLRMTYIATVMNSKANASTTRSDLNLELLKPGFCSESSKQLLMKNGVVFAFMYRNQDLKPIANTEIRAADCGLSVYR